MLVLLGFVFLLFLLLPSARAEESKFFDVMIYAPQASEDGKGRYLCYKLAAEGTNAGEVKGKKDLAALPSDVNLNQPPVYQVTKYSSGLTCYVLKNQGANDFTWTLGGQRLEGCECAGDLTIQK